MELDWATTCTGCELTFVNYCTKTCDSLYETETLTLLQMYLFHTENQTNQNLYNSTILLQLCDLLASRSV